MDHRTGRVHPLALHGCHDPNPGVMTGARERELLYPEPVASLKIKILNKPMHKNANELKLFRKKSEILMP